MNPTTIAKGSSAALILILFFTEIRGFLLTNNEHQNHLRRVAPKQDLKKEIASNMDLNKSPSNLRSVRNAIDPDVLVVSERRQRTLALTRGNSRDTIPETRRNIDHVGDRVERDTLQFTKNHKNSRLHELNSLLRHVRDTEVSRERNRDSNQQTAAYRMERHLLKLNDNRRISERIQRFGNDQRQRQNNEVRNREDVQSNQRNNIRDERMSEVSSRGSPIRRSTRLRHTSEITSKKNIMSDRLIQERIAVNPPRDEHRGLETSRSRSVGNRRITDTDPIHLKANQRQRQVSERRDKEAVERSFLGDQHTGRRAERTNSMSYRTDSSSRQRIGTRSVRSSDNRENLNERQHLLDRISEERQNNKDTRENLEDHRNLERINTNKLSRNARDTRRSISMERNPVMQGAVERNSIRHTVNNLSSRERSYPQEIDNIGARSDSKTRSGVNNKVRSERSRNIRENIESSDRSISRSSSEDRSRRIARISSERNREVSSELAGSSLNFREGSYLQKLQNTREDMGSRITSRMNYRVNSLISERSRNVRDNIESSSRSSFRNSEDRSRRITRISTERNRKVASELASGGTNANRMDFRDRRYAQDMENTRAGLDSRMISRMNYKVRSLVLEGSRNIRDNRESTSRSSYRSRSEDKSRSIIPISTERNRKVASELASGRDNRNSFNFRERSHPQNIQNTRAGVSNKYSSEDKSIVNKRSSAEISTLQNSLRNHEPEDVCSMYMDGNEAQVTQERNEIDFIGKIPISNSWSRTVQVTLASIILGQLLFINGEKHKNWLYPMNVLDQLRSFRLLQSPF